MLKESERNAVVQIALDVMNGGAIPEGLSPEMVAAVKRNAAEFKALRDEMGAEAFSKITIDVGYDY